MTVEADQPQLQFIPVNAYIDGQPLDVPTYSGGEEQESTKASAARGPTKANRKDSPRWSGRNLVVCIDGTANQFGLRNTHVVELYSRLTKDDKQLTYYNSGIGTFVKSSNWFWWLIQLIMHLWDMAVAWNLEKIVLGAYEWLVENYQPGDRIFLFGFSRGAYQVRILAGMLQTTGLLHKGNKEQIPFAYQLYVANTADVLSERQTGESTEKGEESSHDESGRKELDPTDPRFTTELCKQFKRTLSRKGVTVHFVGVWDTVSSVGITRGPSLPETTTGMTHVGACRHALSLDEPRSKFFPEYCNGGAGPVGGDVKEVWFTGSHSDIGGGIKSNLNLDVFGPPLRWMLYEGLEYGLYVERFQGGWGEPQYNSSMNWFWWILEVYPFRRLAYNGQREATRRWPPNLGSGRKIQPGQLIHASVLDHMRNNPTYRPRAQLYNGYSWDAFSLDDVASGSDVFQGPWPIGIEEDFHAAIVTETLSLLKSAPIPSQRITDTLAGVLASFAGRQAISDFPQVANVLFSSLQSIDITPLKDTRAQLRTVTTLAKALAVFYSLPDESPRFPVLGILHWLLLISEEYPNEVSRILHIFGSKIPLYKPLLRHSSAVMSVAYSPDGSLIASASADMAIQLWDPKTGQPEGEPFRGHKEEVWSVAFSPDSKYIVSGSRDKTVRIWDVETRQAVGAPLIGHKGWVLSVAFSPDGRQIVSCSGDNTIQVWDAETGLAMKEPLRGPTYLVESVAFSLDGRHIISGSGGGAIHIWDVETHELVKMLEGHTNIVTSIVFSPDGKRIISGSLDGTIRVWNADTGETMLGPLRGHADAVECVAVAPDGKYIVSSSFDETVRLWDAETGQAIGGPLKGHRDWVTSVVFSPDGRSIVSGSRDSTLMIWEVR